ncbi:hypothetical protein ACQ4PT_013513 [Festuca glaucescens]
MSVDGPWASAAAPTLGTAGPWAWPRPRREEDEEGPWGRRVRRVAEKVGEAKQKAEEGIQFHPMAMAPTRLLRGLIAPLPPSDWLPCTASLLYHQWWLPTLALPLTRWPSCSDGLKLLLALLLVSAALAEVRLVASSSMAPTLRSGDRAVAEKVTYMFRRPSVGDIVFFRVPTALQNCGLNKDVVFIKRVLATPGDFIEVRQGQLIVNGVAQKEHYTATHGASYTMEAMRLPEGHVFVMGDNRNNSCDSRAWRSCGRHLIDLCFGLDPIQLQIELPR